MIGTVLMFDNNLNEGHILGEDKVVYDFHIGEWLSSRVIRIGEIVMYDLEEDEARNIVVEDEILKERTIHLKIDVSLV